MTRNRLLLAMGALLAVFAAVFAWPVTKPGAPTVTEVVMARGVDPRTCEPREPFSVFPARERAHLCIRVIGASVGETELSVRWYVQQHPIPADTHWKAEKSGDGWVAFPLAAGTFEAGEYRVEVLLDGEVKKTLKFTVK